MATSTKCPAVWRSIPPLPRRRPWRGATREDASAFFFTEIAHYLYAGDTALHMAAAAFRRPVAELLVAHGADCRARNRRGAEPLHYAADANHWDPAAQARDNRVPPVGWRGPQRYRTVAAWPPCTGRCERGRCPRSGAAGWWCGPEGAEQGWVHAPAPRRSNDGAGRERFRPRPPAAGGYHRAAACTRRDARPTKMDGVKRCVRRPRASRFESYSRDREAGRQDGVTAKSRMGEDGHPEPGAGEPTTGARSLPHPGHSRAPPPLPRHRVVDELFQRQLRVAVVHLPRRVLHASRRRPARSARPGRRRGPACSSGWRRPPRRRCWASLRR